MRSGLSANCSPFRRVTRITGRSSCSVGRGWGGAGGEAGAGNVTVSIGPGPGVLEPSAVAGPVTPAERPGRTGTCEDGPQAGRRSALQVDQVLQELVGRRDHAAVGLEPA